MGAVATFDFPTFVARYPEFASLTPALAQAYFDEATLYLANDGSGPVGDAGQQLVLLNMLVAHIAKLSGVGSPGGAAAGPQGLVGRISSASEGSVSVSADLSGLPAAAAWLSQTPYGLGFWNATARFRRGRYVPGPPTTAPWAATGLYPGLPGWG